MCSPNVAFQMTVSHKHTIHVDIDNVVEFCQVPGDRDFQLYIVVPEDIFPTFLKKQNCVGSYNKPCPNIPPAVHKSRQYVLCTPLNV